MNHFKINTKKSIYNCAVTKLIQNPYNPNQLISTFYNGKIYIWKLPNLQTYSKLPLSISKLTSLTPFQNSKVRGFLLAVKNGDLMMLNQNFQFINSVKIHQQSISQIIILNDCIITVGYDGRVFFLNKQTFQVIKQLQFEYALFSAVQHQNQLYVSSTKSFIINLQTYECTQTQRYNKFFIASNRVYGSSDQRGLSCVNSNSNNYLPAEYILHYQRRIVIFSDKSICVASQIDKLEYKAKKYSQLSSGESITTGTVCGENIYVGGNQGNIYWITQQQEKQINSN